MQETPAANRIHIGFYGRRNSGKSSLLNAFAGQQTAIVSDEPGTTTDPVSKAMEIHGLGACVLTDTAGFDDTGALGESRVEKTKQAAEKTEIALLLFGKEGTDTDFALEKKWHRLFKKMQTPVIPVVNKADILNEDEISGLTEQIMKCIGIQPIILSAKTGIGLESLKEQLLRTLPEDYAPKSIIGGLAEEGDAVLLVMPQDIQAPKGRLILPQVQTIRELLDKKCIVISTTTDKMQEALATLKNAPKLIITDSQVFRTVYEQKPEESFLTSFSVLFAAQKGDINYYVESAAAIGRLNDASKVLIAECCTHAPMTEDIGRVKIPRMLRSRYGEGMDIRVVSGTDFPEDVTGYDLIIQCGGCMFNRKYVMSRIERAKSQRVPMTNYGIAIAWLTGILDYISYVK